MTREEAIDVLKHNYPSTCFEDLCDAVEVAIQALSADAVPVVRCKDCVFYEPNDEWIWGCCRCTGAGMEPDGFCSDGEREDDDKAL